MDVNHYQTKSIEQKTLETLGRIEALVRSLGMKLDAQLIPVEDDDNTPDYSPNLSTPRAPKRTRK